MSESTPYYGEGSRGGPSMSTERRSDLAYLGDRVVRAKNHPIRPSRSFGIPAALGCRCSAAGSNLRG